MSGISPDNVEKLLPLLQVIALLKASDKPDEAAAFQSVADELIKEILSVDDGTIQVNISDDIAARYLGEEWDELHEE